MCSGPQSKAKRRRQSNPGPLFFSRSPSKRHLPAPRRTTGMVTDADPATPPASPIWIAWTCSPPPGRAAVSVLKSLQDARRDDSSCWLPRRLRSSDGRAKPLAARSCLPAHRCPLCHSAAAPAPGRHYRAGPALLAHLHLYQQRPVSSPRHAGRLLQHNWPATVRELAAVLETALLEAATRHPPRRPGPAHGPRIPAELRPEARTAASISIPSFSSTCSMSWTEPRQQAPRAPPARHQPLHTHRIWVTRTILAPLKARGRPKALGARVPHLR